MQSSNLVKVGKIGRPHGVHGEVRLFLYNPSSEIIEAGQTLYIHSHDGSTIEAELQSVRSATKFYIVKFKGVSGRHRVESMTNCEIAVPYEVLPELEDGEFYHRDLIGMEVIAQSVQGADAPTAQLGHVARVFGTGANDVLVVSRPSLGELFVPMIEDAVVDISLSDRRITLAPLECWVPADEVDEG